VGALVRGDRELNEVKLQRALGASSLEAASPEIVEGVTGAPVGFAGPVGLKGVRILADHEVVAIQDGITGANKADAHLAHVQYGRDYEADEVVDIRTVVERSEEHTSELQSRENLVCRLLLEKKKTKTQTYS